MFTKKYKVTIVGLKEYEKTTESGKPYTLRFANCVYQDKDNKCLKGYDVDTIKTSEELELDKHYEVVMLFNKVNDKYYKEIVSATLLK